MHTKFQGSRLYLGSPGAQQIYRVFGGGHNRHGPTVTVIHRESLCFILERTNVQVELTWDDVHF